MAKTFKNFQNTALWNKKCDGKMAMNTFLDVSSFKNNPHVMSGSDTWSSLRTGVV